MNLFQLSTMKKETEFNIRHLNQQEDQVDQVDQKDQKDQVGKKNIKNKILNL